jgi:sporulation protein YqfC
MLDLPKITLIGNLQLYIENHRGIIEYRPEDIRISVSTGELEVIGRELVIRNISREEIYLDGVIQALRFNQ